MAYGANGNQIIKIDNTELRNQISKVSKSNMQPLFVETFASFSHYGVGVPSGVANYTDGNYTLTVDGVAGNNYFTVTAGNIADAGQTTTWAAVVEKSDQTFEGYRVTGTDGIDKVYVYPNVRENVTGVTLGNLHDMANGQHYTELGYRAFGQHIFNNSGYHSQRLKYIQRFLGSDTESDWVAVGDVTSITYNRGLHPVDLDDGLTEGDNSRNLTFVTDAIGEGLEWEVPVDKSKGYFEGSFGVYSGTDIKVEFFIDNILQKTHQVYREVERVIFDFDFGDIAKVRVTSNTANATTVRISNCYWWVTQDVKDNVFDTFNKKAVYLGDSWGTYHNAANPSEIERLWKQVNPGATVVNHSAGGMTTAYGRAWFDEYVLQENPDIVVIEYFTNDINTIITDNNLTFTDPDGNQRNTEVTEAEYFENLRYMVDTAIQNNIQPIVVMPAGVAGTTQTQYHAQYNAIFANGGSVMPANGNFKQVSSTTASLGTVSTDEIKPKTAATQPIKVSTAYHGMDIKPTTQPYGKSYARILHSNGDVVFDFRESYLKGLLVNMLELNGIYGEQGIHFPFTQVVDNANVFKIKERVDKTLNRIELGENVSDGVEMKAAMKLYNATTLPTANSTNRGKVVRIEGGTGVADAVYVCIKNATDTYEWKQI